MKTVYFVRHGATDNNTAERYNTLETPLSSIGYEQAKIVADRCARLPIEVVLSSTIARAQETARIIAERTELKIGSSDLFRERGTPRGLLGKSRSDPEAREYERAWWRDLENQAKHFSDGETFEDMRTRVGKAVEYLEGRSENNILVVTHGFFLQFLIAYVIFGAKLTGDEMAIVKPVFSMENVGLTILRHQPNKNARTPWTIWIWNDHAHLG